MIDTLIIVVPLLLLHLIIPAYLLAVLWRSQRDSKFGWLVKLLVNAGFLAYVWFVGRWDWVTFYGRYLYLILFLGVAIYSYWRVRDRPFFSENDHSPWRRYASPLLSLIIVAGLLAYTLSGLFVEGEAVRLQFPLADGRFYVAQGGSSPILNAHAGADAQQFAVDITELNSVGLRADGIYPSQPDQYVIFEQPVTSPCAGEVLQAVDGLSDNNPPQRDSENLAGNHVILACKGVHILLAHLEQGSVQVQQGQEVSQGEVLGRVGNSGNTTEPHLHIHAIASGTGNVMQGQAVPILFDETFPARNTVFAGS